jgi:hypothetical protein
LEGDAGLTIFETKLEEWIAKQKAEEANPRRREFLNKELGHGTIEFLKLIWFPTIGNFEHLYAEWEVRDLHKGYRYLDLAYMPGGAKGCIEVHGYRSHARDIEVWRFKDLCLKQGLMGLDDWLFMPLAYLSIQEEPELCKQMVLSFVGKFVSMPVASDLDWAEVETLRFARRLLRPFTWEQIAAHLRLSERHTRRILVQLVDMQYLVVVGGKQRYRAYQLAEVAEVPGTNRLGGSMR